MAQVGVLFVNQTNCDKPWLHISRTTAKLYVANKTHEWLKITHRKVSKHIIRELVANSTQTASPERHYIPKLIVTEIAKLLPPQLVEGSMDLYYPAKSQSSYATRDFLELWNSPDWARRAGAYKNI